MSKPKPIKFKGELQHPIEVPTFKPSDWEHLEPKLSSDLLKELEAKSYQEWIQKCLEKLPLLFKYFGIEDETDYQALTLYLAINFIPGFRRENVSFVLSNKNYGAVIQKRIIKGGRSKEWSDEKLIKLANTVDFIKQKNSISMDREAIKLVARQSEFSMRSKSQDIDKWWDTLIARLHDGRQLLRKKQKIAAGVEKLMQETFKIKNKLKPETGENL